MDFLMNDLSIHGQFHSAAEFVNSVDTLMAIRQSIRRAGSELFCHRDLKDAKVTQDLAMPQAIQGMPLAKRRAWMQWLTNLGPYWVDERQHDENDWLELVDGSIVTDKAFGEAAYCRMHGLQRDIVSLDPSDWLQNAITVIWRKPEEMVTVQVLNHWTEATVTHTLSNLPKPFNSWKSLESHARRTCVKLMFSDGAFAPLEGQPYVHGAAERIQIRLEVLNTMRGCFDDGGNRTPEGHRLYTDHFTGDKAWFTDSSDTEKREFKRELMFPHPQQSAKSLFCTWHGKVKTPQLRIHFSWPLAAEVPLYVVYVGPKITKR